MLEHPIPDAALDADIATLAQKGAGKTYLNKGLVERLLDMRRRLVIMDPLNIWWGLKALADGSPGYSVVVVGGPNADVPLDPKMGKELGAFVAMSDVQMVIDVSEMRTNELVSFSTAFLAELYRLNRDPLWLILEEADVFAPQNPQGTESFLLHEVDMIARRGRQRGFRLWTICQRPQEINKKTLSQTATMVLMRLMSPQDREAAKKWLLAHGTKAEADQIINQLPSLKVGEGYILAPTLGILQRAVFPAIRTLDNSATPKAGEKRVGVKALARVDVAALRSALVSTEPAVSSKALATGDIAAIEAAAYKRGFDDGERAEWARAMTVTNRVLDQALDDVRRKIDEIYIDRSAHPFLVPPAESVEAKAVVAPAGPKARAVRAKPAPTSSGNADALSEAASNILTAARMAPRLVDWSEAALLAGMIPSGGYFNGLRRELKDAGWGSTPPGNDLVADGPMISGVDLLEKFSRKLTKGAATRVFSTLYVEGPMTKPEVARALGMAGQGGYWNATWKALRGSPLVRELDDQRWDVAMILRELREAAHAL